MNDRGYVHIVARIKDIVITGGPNVFTREIEDALLSHAAVTSAAVFGVPDPRWGEAVAATVVLRDGMSVEADKLVAQKRDRKSPVHALKQLHLLAHLPLTAISKIDKNCARSFQRLRGADTITLAGGSVPAHS